MFKVQTLVHRTCTAAATAATAAMCDRWEDADDDIKPLGKQGRVARLGIAGFVACALAGEQLQQSGGHHVIVDSKRVSLCVAMVRQQLYTYLKPLNFEHRPDFLSHQLLAVVHC